MPSQRGSEVTIKKYSNRRLYDTSESRYITLDELAQKIRAGHRAKVVDAKSGADLTQATFAQIILESRRAARLLPVPLLEKLIRMGDDALSEFFSSYMSWALDIYLQARQGAKAIAPFNPFATLPFSGANVIARMFNQIPWSSARPRKGSTFDGIVEAAARLEQQEAEALEHLSDPSGVGAATGAKDLGELRREIDELKDVLRQER